MWLAIDFDPYHFACDGPFLGIPHFWNVVTNLPFVLLGAWRLRFLSGRGLLGDPRFRNWQGIWWATIAIAVGSGCYHWFLTPWGLGLDRVAIAGLIAFLGMQVAHVALGFGPSLGLTLLALLVCEGTVVAWWLGAGPWGYALIQGGGALAVLAVTIHAHRGGRLAVSPVPLYAFLGTYGVAKLFEVLDEPVCGLTGFIGGHAIKHLVSGLGLLLLGRMMVAEADRVEPVA
jgi:hypothetical protein